MMFFTLLFCLLSISNAISQEDFLAKQQEREREYYERKRAKEADFYERKRAKEAEFYSNLQKKWQNFMKIPEVSLPVSPDSLDLKTVEIPKIKAYDNPNIEIIDALLKEGIDTIHAVNIALEIIDSLGIDAIKEGQSIGIAIEKNNKKFPVVISYKVDSSETSTLLRGKANDYKYVEQTEGKAGRNCKINLQYTFPLNSCRKTSGFGMREHPLLKKNKKHEGVDYSAAKGTSVYAIADGTVMESSFTQVNGNYVAIKHSNGLVSYYLHLNEKGVEKGTHVEAGQTIGKVGSTGFSTSPHLHLGVKKNGVWQNPEKVLGITLSLRFRLRGKNFSILPQNLSFIHQNTGENR